MFHVANLKVFSVLGGKLIVTGRTLLVGWSEYLLRDALDVLARFGTAGASVSVSSGEALRLDVDVVRLGGIMGRVMST